MPKTKKKRMTYKRMMAEILKSKSKPEENNKIEDVTGGGVPEKVVKI
jgi:hypothetical protein